ncbi:triglyceride lipase [Malassezia pachydermatis]|uniref:triacylglycerol lipase n=1 Tax=Malassezia pachydermatis TaxID=77020 RepID=A0A0M8MNP3_9BASI|nr:putative secretory lipase (family lip) [Malassezia pachydermatis]KOS16166.1 putative secretory lipase (family lip) [Malassezia pachydermatis]
MRFWSLAPFLLVSAYQVLAVVVRRDLPFPDEDPFYQPPSGWENEKLGTILRTRQIDPKAIFDLDVKEAWQLLYRTSYKSDDEPTTTVTTIVIPHNAKQDKLVVYGDFVDANGPQCAPSYGFRDGAGEDLGFLANVALMMPYLQGGYIVTVPDKQGKINAFASGRVEGHQTLDGIRATLNFDKLNLTDSVKVAGWGYSGGAIQIGWAASLQPSYAPELPMVGWYYGGTPVSIPELVNTINETVFSGFLVGGITGLADSYPDLKDFIDKFGTKESKDAMNFARTHCMFDIVLKYPFQNFASKKYATIDKNFLQVKVFQDVLTSLIMGRSSDETPRVPVMMSHGKADEIAPYDSAYQAFKNWCDYGANIHFRSYSSGLAAHVITAISDITESYKWIVDRLNGKKMASGCTESSTNDVILDTKALGPNFEHLLGIIGGVLDGYIGPGDKILQRKIADGNLP